MAWWTAPSGATAVAAYDAIGATSLADSYTDESGSGNDAAPGVAPTWAAGVGWTFNGGWLTTGLVPGGAAWSYAVRFSAINITAERSLIGAREETGGRKIVWIDTYGTTGIQFRNGGSGVLSLAEGRSAAGVAIMAGGAAYFEGTNIGSVAGGSMPPYALYVNATNYEGVAQNANICTIEAVAIYSQTLTAADVSTITTAMNALPATGGGLLRRQAAHYRALWAGGVPVG